MTHVCQFADVPGTAGQLVCACGRTAVAVEVVDTPPGDSVDALKQRLDYWIDATAAATERAITAEHLIRSVQAELLAGGSPARLRAILGLTKETRTDA